MSIFVKKRNGKLEEFNAEKINKVVEWSCDGIQDVNPSDVAMSAKLSIHNKILTSSIQDVLVQAASNLTTENTPNYQYVAARLKIYALRKDVWGESEPPRLYDHLRKNKKIYDDCILEMYTESEIHKINKFLKHDRDYLFTHAGIEQMIDKYLICDRISKKIYETPQFAFILVPMILFRNYANRLELVKEMYDYVSTFKINLPTPILAGVRSKLKFYSSCVLADCGDSIDSIFTTAHVVGKYTARRSGIGVNMGRIRAVGSPIRNSEVISTGIIPFLKVIESAVKSTSQNGLRGGGATVSFPWWHAEVEDILVLKNNRGTDDNRVRKLDYCIQLEKVFYDRVIENKTITLFCPNEVKDLYDAFGLDSFKDLYEKYENDKSIKIKKVISARDLIAQIAKERLETGRIYIMNIDHVNKSPWKEKINMVNLCVAPETMLLTKNGYFPISSLKDSKVEVWNGKRWSETVVSKTGINQKLITVLFSNGNSLNCTEYHDFYVDSNDYISSSESKYNKESVLTKIKAINLKPNMLCRSVDCDTLNQSLVKIVKIINNNRFDDTYCVNEPTEHKAVFNGIITGNCVEITQPTGPLQSTADQNGEIGICILSAINLLEVKTEELEGVCKIIVYALNELIDYQEYPFEAARKFCQEKRSLGVGLTNFAAWLASKKLNHESIESIKESNDIMEKVQYYLLSASCKMAEESGRAKQFNMSHYSDEFLPCDKKRNKEFDFPLTMDWENLRGRIKKFGLKNCTLTAQMPCESSSVVQCSTNGVEPIRALLTEKEAKNGVKKVLTPKFPKMKNYYSRAFDVKSNDNLLKIYGAMQYWIDMAMSINTYLNYNHYPDGKIPHSVIIKDIMSAYKYGIKTLYYNNTPDDRSEGMNKEQSCESGACSI